MIRLPFALVSLARVIQAITTNSTSTSCLQPAFDVTTRSVWSLLGSCALTLLICVWHAIHFNLPSADTVWYEKPLLILSSFFAPEVVVTIAFAEWWDARDRVMRFQEKGYTWSMTHSFFAEMGGFVYRDEEGKSRTIDSLKFLELCEANKIANPLITTREIKALSKSDVLGKAIFVLQLLWFTLQVVVRGSHGLAVTLVELDTVSIAALTLLVLWFWWEKPLRPESPHTFYYSPPGVELYPLTDSVLRNAWKPEPNRLCTLVADLICTRKSTPITDGEEIALIGAGDKSLNSRSSRPVAKNDGDHIGRIPLCGTWMILGGLHLIAWNFDFPTGIEKVIWRISSLVLVTGPLLFLLSMVTLDHSSKDIAENVSVGFVVFAGILGIVSRTLLVALMLASLRALPHSAYQTVSWTAYIPHL